MAMVIGILSYTSSVRRSPKSPRLTAVVPTLWILDMVTTPWDAMYPTTPSFRSGLVSGTCTSRFNSSVPFLAVTQLTLPSVSILSLPEPMTSGPGLCYDDSAK
ncbi:hypothetical protein N7481_003044 [Penicillium waksmanii]|uniref:uncharacterized protein n=1 Tax=Penicillium waksmanii TaxID=69791 RepID=UPI0025499CC0|nr:uncharacterized protein N7481_003044 [Penicillium waksmanii]KAJ5987834.1 hypothetical protein N7481_003044 [Penicillium waksmanii]